MKIGRNQPCPCGSKLKYKKCCGQLNERKSVPSMNPYPRPIPKEILIAIERHKAEELIREQQQGLGNPIVSVKIGKEQLVAVDNIIYHSETWKTFPDFLVDYLRSELGTSWGSSEIAKPFSDRHIILQWYEECCNFRKKHSNGSGEVKTIQMSGIVCCYLGLAYSVYLLRHNVALQIRLINRLKDPEQFQGAYYELIVANCLIRAGFDLILENETDGRVKHCEFSAVSKETKKKYWVEAKMRSVFGHFGKTRNTGSTKIDPTSKLIDHLKGALEKPALDERLIFIDINADILKDDEQPIWVEDTIKKLKAYESSVISGDKAYVFITNMCFHRNLLSENIGHAAMAYGLRIPDFCKPGSYRFSEIYRQKQKHIDAYCVMESLKTYPQLPSTFDGSLPSVTFDDENQHITIGETYVFKDENGEEIIGTVTSGTISEEQKMAYIVICTEDGMYSIVSKPISDSELMDYKKHPEAFFGKIQNQTKKIDTPYETFEFFMGSFKNMSKEKLVESMKDVKDVQGLNKMGQLDLLLEYCERLGLKVASEK